MSKTFRERLAEPGVLICDGAMGTMLQREAPALGLCPEELNLTQPAIVRKILASYVAAGADIITTNSFGGNRHKLGRGGLAAEVHRINRAAAQVAREVAEGKAFIAGDIGPLGAFLEPVGELSYVEAVEIFAEQGHALAEGGVDLFIVETMYDLNEVRAAVEALRQVAALPIVCSLTFDQGGRTMMGVTPAQAARTLNDLGVDVLGTNCGSGPEETEGALREMRLACPDALLIAQPNAGLPIIKGGQVRYNIDPEQMAVYARRFVDEYGVKIVGSCCGSTPEHTRAIAQALRQ